MGSRFYLGGTVEELWDAQDSEGNSCTLGKEDDHYTWFMTDGMFFSGYPAIRLDRKHLKDLFEAIGHELKAF